MQNRKYARLMQAGIIALSLTLAGCGGEGSSTPTPTPAPTATPTATPTPAPTPTPTPTSRPAQVERDILPATANAALLPSDAANFTINPDPAATPRGKLFVMLPGTGAIPRNYRTVVRTGAGRGYHGIGLTYVNEEAVGELCSLTAGGSDLNCAGKARREIITGENLSTLIAVSPDAAITGRLTALLGHMNRTYPNEGWGQFLKNGAVDWSLVTVAGHSQGAGHAAYMAKLYVLDRSVMFSGPADVPAAGQSAAQWFSLPNLTPTSRQYGFTHINDELVPYSLVRANWNASGFDAAISTPFLIDGASDPFGGGRLFYTSAAPSALGATNAAPRHSSPVADGITPSNAQGTPLYAPIWIYMAFP